MSQLKFAANISWLFKESGDMASRYSAAKCAGFSYVESAYPYNENIANLVEAKDNAKLKHVLINAYQGDPAKKEAGITALPTHKGLFKEKLDESIGVAEKLCCTRMHVMAGKVAEDNRESSQRLMEETYLENIKYAADVLQQKGILLLIEPINSKYSVPNYFLHDVNQAVRYIKLLNHPNVKLQADIFHWQIIHGDLTGMITEYFPHIGHVQIAQVPNRGEPSQPGEINYKYVFDLLRKLDYQGYVACEYNPSTDITDDSLQWLHEEQKDNIKQ